jgi:hypothetical protein
VGRDDRKGLRYDVLGTGPMSQDLNPCMTPVFLDAKSTGETQVKVQFETNPLESACQAILPRNSYGELKRLSYPYDTVRGFRDRNTRRLLCNLGLRHAFGTLWHDGLVCDRGPLRLPGRTLSLSEPRDTPRFIMWHVYALHRWLSFAVSIFGLSARGSGLKDRLVQRPPGNGRRSPGR